MKCLKRITDFIISMSMLIILLPLLTILTILVRVNLGAPVLFKQKRPGKNGKIFTMYKFRTMLDAHDKNGQLLPDEARLTKFGKFLRATSLDELPELFNVLKGDMSLVGPRPLLVEYLAIYTSEQMRRHEVKPGITGWAQVNGRNTLTWDKKFKLDIWYIDNWSLWLDIKIIFMTFYKVVKRDGISHTNCVTMEKFKGGKELMTK